jgi:hypothetical protein
MDWTHILAYVTGTVDQELLARNEYLAAENRILKSQLNGRLKLSDTERAMLGKIGHRLGRRALWSEPYLRRILRSYANYYNNMRTHRSLNKDAPTSRPIQRIGIISSRPILGGLRHHYVRV